MAIPWIWLKNNRDLLDLEGGYFFIALINAITNKTKNKTIKYFR